MKDNTEDYPLGPPVSSSPEAGGAVAMPTTSGPAGGFLCFPSVDLRMEPPEATCIKFEIDQYKGEAFRVMYTLFQTGKLTDVVLRADCELIPCHRVVLAGASPYFRAMFTSGMREADMPEIPIHCVSPTALSRLVHFAYTGEIMIGERNVCELLPAATMLQMTHVVHACSTFLERQLHPSNVIGIHEFANSNGCIDLARRAEAFIDQNFSEVVKHDEFLCLKPCQMISLIKREELNVRTEAEVFNAVVRWANYDRPGRVATLLEALAYVRCHALPPHFIQGQIKNCPLFNESELCRDHLQRVLHDLIQHRKVNDRRRTAGHAQMIYAAGGYLRYSLSTLMCYDPVVNTWHRLPDLPSPRSGLSACSVRSSVYLVGGRNNNEEGNIDAPHMDCYDPAANLWHVCAPMSVPRNRVAIGVIDDMIYAVGGSTHTMHHSTAEKYDPDMDQWTPIASMHHRRIGLGVAVVNRLLYAVGGFDGEHRLASVERYNPEEDRWQLVAGMNRTRSGAGVVALDQFVYAIGGYDSCNQLRSVERYDPDRDCWDFVAPMIRPRSALSATVLDGKIWVFGGYDGNEFLASVEVYDPVTNGWTERTVMECGKSGHAVVVGREPVLN